MSPKTGREGQEEHDGEDSVRKEVHEHPVLGVSSGAVRPLALAGSAPAKPPAKAARTVEGVPAAACLVVAKSAFATAVGLVLYGQRHRVVETARTTGAGAFGRVAGRLKGLFREFF